MKSSHKLVLPIAIAAVTLGTTSAFGQFLNLIPEISGDADTVTMSGRAITPDGAYVVGNSGSRGFFYPVGGSSIQVLSSDGALALQGLGIGYRTSGGTELVVSGQTSSGPAEFMTPDGGTTWGVKRRNTALSGNSMGSANQLGSSLASDVYYVSSSAGAGNPVYLTQISGTWGSWTINETQKGISSPANSIMYGVSSVGRAVGRRGSGSSTYGAYVLDYTGGTPANYYINTLNDGLNGGSTTLGELWSVSNDGTTMFGRSFLTGNSSAAGYHAFKTTVSLDVSHTQGSVNQLPELPGTVTSVVPYGASADGKYAVGMDYIGVETAALWDTTSANPADWAVINLYNFATTLGLDPAGNGWISFNRAFSVADTGNGLAITGQGTWSPDGGTTTATRAFVIMVPEPGTFGLVALGGLLFAFLRKRRS